VSKIEVTDDSDNEITEITIPIPFYIRVRMDEGMSRYRVKLIDDSGGIRGQYMGSTDQELLELHVPLIKLPKPGKIRILVEESTGDSNYSQQYSVSLRYLDYIPITTLEDTSEILTESDENILKLDQELELINEKDNISVDNTVDRVNKDKFDVGTQNNGEIINDVPKTQNIEYKTYPSNLNGIESITEENETKSMDNAKSHETELVIDDVDQSTLSEEEIKFLFQKPQKLREELNSEINPVLEKTFDLPNTDSIDDKIKTSEIIFEEE
jgi:hypothetical protein